MDQVKTLEELFVLIKSDDSEILLDKLRRYHKQGFEINKTNEYGNTLLHIACRCRNYTAVEALVYIYDAHVDIKNLDGRTPLHMAIMYGSSDIACYISQNGKAKKQIKSSSDIISKIVERSPHVLMIEDNDHKTPMNYYSMHSDLGSNKSIKKRYKSYNIKMNFFDLLRKEDPEDCQMSIDIYFLMKEGQK